MMDAEALQAFLAQPNDAIVATNRPGKGAQLSPVWFLWNGETFFISTSKATTKYTNILRDPNISLIVNDTATHTFVAAYGQAEIISQELHPAIMNKLLEKYVPVEKRAQFAQAIEARRHSDSIIVALKPVKITSFTAPI